MATQGPRADGSGQPRPLGVSPATDLCLLLPRGDSACKLGLREVVSTGRCARRR